MHTGTTGIVPHDAEQETVCKTCHNSTQMAGLPEKWDVGMHEVTKGGPRTIDCGSCHEMHNGYDFDTVDTHIDGVTATNLSRIRQDTSKYVTGALEPAIFQTDPDHFAFAETTGSQSGAPWNGICQSCHTNASLQWHTNDGSATGPNPHDHNKVGAQAVPDCMSCHSHSAGFPTPTCFSCHSGPQDNSDGLPVGGRRAVWGEFSQNSHHAATAVEEADCLVCHDQTTHMDGKIDLKNADTGALIVESASGRFRKANLIEGDINNLNTFCQSCHDANGAQNETLPGDPFGDSSAGPPEMSLHSNVDFATDRVEGAFTIGCIQCHEGHGSTNRKIIDDTSVLINNSVGLSSPGTTSGPVVFTATTGDNSGDEYLSGADPSETDDICVTCHIGTTVNHDGGDHTASTQGTDERDNDCTSCHPHGSSETEKKGFMPPAGGAATCDTCHATGGTGTTGANNRRVIWGIDGDFSTSSTSHHVNDGTGSEIVTKWDCATCHAEVDALTGNLNSTYHDNGLVEMRHADNTTTSYNTNGVYGDWASITPAARSDFCLSCHDDDGATIISGRTDPDPDATTDALDPFNDGVTNSHEPDGFDGTTAPHMRYRVTGQTGAGSPGVVDVKSQFDVTNPSHHAVLGPAYGPGSTPDTTAPGGSLAGAVFGTLADGSTPITWESTLSCEDCHYGSATTKLNGHGTTNSRYMLRDASGNDAVGDFSSKTLNCHACHDVHANPTNFPAHTGQDGNHQTDNDNIFGIACLNCHGGGLVESYFDKGNPASYVSGAFSWGMVHGVPAAAPTITGVTPNVFAYGNAIGNVTNWTDLGSPSCGAIEPVTAINNCNNHNGRGTSDGKTYTRPYSRAFRAP
jgi:hypothetical protein